LPNTTGCRLDHNRLPVNLAHDYLLDCLCRLGTNWLERRDQDQSVQKCVIKDQQMAYGGSLFMMGAYSTGSSMWSRCPEVQRASFGQCLGRRQVHRGRDSSLGKASTGQSFGRSQTGKSQINIILSDAIPGYLEPSIRQSSYAAVRPTRLALVLQKLAKGTAATPGGGAMSRAERRRMEADQVARLPNA
jgi:hypothetical protein